jgi:hypothetical protein
LLHYDARLIGEGKAVKVIKETIGNTTVFIQAVDDDTEVVGEAQTGRATQPTGIEDEFTHAYAKLKSILKGFAHDVGSEVKSIATDTRPGQLEMEFNMGLSAQLGAWVVSGTSECALKVTMIWDFKGSEENP